MTAETRRTKRRYAHELYPHADEWEIRPLAVEVPYLYARMVGLTVMDTGWMSVEPRSAAGDRIGQYISAVQTALLADALAQGMTGDAAWEWVTSRTGDDNEIAYDRAAHYGVPVDRIKPYPCGPDPDHHDHYSEPDARGWRTVITIAIPESACDECTEAVGAVAEKDVPA